MTNLRSERRKSMKKQIKRSMAKGVKAALDMVLRTEANSTSCCLLYQPKAPEGLRKYRRM
jgi:hypothetical protein